jgi:hypothetical protein
MLYRIASIPAIYNNPARWDIIYEANKAKFPNPKNPNLIRPGIVLEIPSINGEKREGNYDPNLKYTPVN